MPMFGPKKLISQPDFLKIEQNSEKYFFDHENVKNKIWKKIYIKQYITPGEISSDLDRV